MHESYIDIISRINDKPLWWDSNGVPRYDKFKPDMCPDIYAYMVILMQVACQLCHRKFKVEMETRDDYKSGRLKPHYGDPPFHLCTGDSMNCVDLKILECWQLENFKWKRRKELEGKIK